MVFVNGTIPLNWMMTGGTHILGNHHLFNIFPVFYRPDTAIISHWFYQIPSGNLWQILKLALNLPIIPHKYAEKHVQYDHSLWSYDIFLIFNFETISIYIPTGYLPFTSIHIHHNHWLVVWLPFLAFSHSDWVGISSSQLTNSIFRRVAQPPTRDDCSTFPVEQSFFFHCHVMPC